SASCHTRPQPKIAPVIPKSPEKLFPFPLNNRHNFLPDLSYPVIPAHPFIRGQAFNKTFLGKFKHHSADRGAIKIKLFGKFRRVIGFDKRLEHLSSGPPPADKTHQVKHLIKMGKLTR